MFKSRRTQRKIVPVAIEVPTFEEGLSGVVSQDVERASLPQEKQRSERQSRPHYGGITEGTSRTGSHGAAFK